MISPHASQLSAIEVLCIANDARYLFKKLRRSSEAEVISAELSTAEILRRLEAFVKNPPTNVEDLLSVYLHMLALEWQGPDAVAQLTPDKVPPVQWADEFFNLLVAPVDVANTTKVFKVDDFQDFRQLSDQHLSTFDAKTSKRVMKIEG
ncbi:hypothetical protein [Schlesneria sp.]|uniref:hypothetical protein n=1 Tax=Schlesneria sp. TaxID=2762018 RepID=UPI002EFFE20D